MQIVGWKGISDYLKCGIRTAQRWEKHGLPIRQIPSGGTRGPVFAYSNELDKWLSGSGIRKGHHRRQSDLIKESARLRSNVERGLKTLHKNVDSLQQGFAAMPKIDNIRVRFLMTDLSVGLTFARAAASSRSPDNQKRRLQSARRAYDVTTKVMAQAKLDDQQRKELETRARKLKRALEQLGEVF